MARYDADGYRADGRKRISGYSREIQGGADEARARGDARRERQYTNRLQDRGIGTQMEQFRNPDGSIRADRGVTVPSFGGGTKTVMPTTKVTPREKLPSTIRRPDMETEGMEKAGEMVDKMTPTSSYTGSLNRMFDELRSKKRRAKVMRPTV